MGLYIFVFIDAENSIRYINLSQSFKSRFILQKILLI